MDIVINITSDTKGALGIDDVLCEELEIGKELKLINLLLKREEVRFKNNKQSKFNFGHRVPFWMFNLTIKTLEQWTE